MHPRIVFSVAAFFLCLFPAIKFIHEPYQILWLVISHLLAINIVASSDIKYNIRFFASVKYLIWLIKEIIISSINVSLIILNPRSIVRSDVKYIETSQNSDVGMVIYANSITLTPGTISVKIKGRDILVHALCASSIDELDEKIMDKKILKIVKSNV